MRIFLTGFTGYIGQQLALSALEQGFSVAALVRSQPAAHFLNDPNLQLYDGDITDFASVMRAMQDCNAVLHTAALTQLWHRDPSAFYRINVMGTRNVLEAALRAGVQRVVFTSSCAVLGPSGAEPVTEQGPRLVPFENEYELSKYCAEALVQEYAGKGLPVVTVAPPRVYGPGLLTKGNPINLFIRNTLRRGIAFMPAAKEVVANYAYIGDIVRGHFLAMEQGKSGEKYVLGGENVSYATLFRTIAAEGGKKLRIIPVPTALLMAWAAVAFGLSFMARRHSHVSPKTVARLLQNRAVSCEKAVTQLGYSVTPFREGIAATIAHLKEVNEL